jgi:large subunit ribosomal protein L4
MKLNVYAKDGNKTNNTVELSEAVFGIEPNDHAIWLEVRALQANKRQGTHSTKGRSYVSGGGRKPFRQKGTGRARQGTIRAPHHVGGGRVFGPEPRSYNMKINKKVKQLARRSVLTYKAREEKIFVVEDFNFEKPSTKGFTEMLSGLNLSGKRVLLCTADYAPALVKSAANIYKVQVCESNTFSAYDLLKADVIVFQEGALNKVNEVLGK